MLVVELGEPGVPVTCCAEAGVAARSVTAISVLQSLVLMTLVLQLGASRHDLSTLRTQWRELVSRVRLRPSADCTESDRERVYGNRTLVQFPLDRSRERTEEGRTLSV